MVGCLTAPDFLPQSPRSDLTGVTFGLAPPGPTTAPPLPVLQGPGLASLGRHVSLPKASLGFLWVSNLTFFSLKTVIFGGTSQSLNSPQSKGDGSFLPPPTKAPDLQSWRSSHIPHYLQELTFILSSRQPSPGENDHKYRLNLNLKPSLSPPDP